MSKSRAIPDDPDQLTELQRRFALEYCLDPCGTRAARRAGCSPRSANQTSQKWLKTPKVVAAIEREPKDRTSRIHIEADGVLRELAVLTFSDMADLTPLLTGECGLEDLDEDLRRSIATCKVRRSRRGKQIIETIEIKLWNKLHALRMLSQHLGLLKDRVEVTGKDGEPIKLIEIYMPDNYRREIPIGTDRLAAPSAPV